MRVGNSQQRRTVGALRHPTALLAGLLLLVGAATVPAADAEPVTPTTAGATAPVPTTTAPAPTTSAPDPTTTSAPTTSAPTTSVPTTAPPTSGVEPAPRTAAEAPTARVATPVSEAPDYASEVLGNPWDFSDAADRLWLQRSKVWAPIVSDTIQYTGDVYNTLYLLNAWGGDLPHGRDGRVVPVDPTRYRFVSFKATAANLPSPTAGAIFWFNCRSLASSCFGAQSYQLKPGTHVYTVPVHLGSLSVGGATAPWSGEIAKLWLATTGSPSLAPVMTIDWIRIHGDTGNPTTDPYPPGVHSIGGGDYAIDARPRPVVTDPDLAGGDDYATVVRGGDGWDMNQVSDLAGWVNANVSVSGGRAHGSSSGDFNNPVVWFGAPQSINTRRWHRLQLKVSYDGPFGLANAPGGGMVGRFVWTNPAAGAAAVQESNDLLVYPGDQELTVDLHTSPAAAVNDEGTSSPKGWGAAGSTVVYQPRWDPHEDPGHRTWRIDEVRLRRNDIADPGFTIRFREDPTTHEGGTTARVYLVATPGAGGGTEVTSGPMAVVAGENTVALDARTLAVQGDWWVRVDMTDPSGDTTSAWSTGPVETSTPMEFIDVLPGNAFYWDVRWLVKQKIANGYSPDEYRPTAPISRQAMAAFLYRQAGSPDGASPTCSSAPFPDVGVGGLFCGEIAWLADEGIAGGYPDGTFGATRPISRQAMAAFLYRAANPGGGEPPACAVAPFPDVPVASPFCGHITWMKGTGITGGYADGTYRPGNPVSRQAMARFLRVFDGL